MLTYPKVYKLENKRRNYYEQELVAAPTSTDEKDQKYFVERTRTTQQKILRSGKKTGGQKEFLLKARNQPNLSRWITQSELDNLQKNGYVF